MSEEREETPQERRRRQLRESQRRRRAGLPKLRQPAACGRHSGVRAHETAGERLCDECRAFLAAYQRARYVPTGRSGGRPKKPD